MSTAIFMLSVAGGRRVTRLNVANSSTGSISLACRAERLLLVCNAPERTGRSPLGTYLPDYPNREVATKVTIHELLTHTGGTADPPFFDGIAHRMAAAQRISEYLDPRLPTAR